MKTTRGFLGLGALLLIVLGIFVVGGGAYYVTHQQSLNIAQLIPTQAGNNATSQSNSPSATTDSSFKTYSNSQYGISFKYPAEWGEVVLTPVSYTGCPDTEDGSSKEAVPGELPTHNFHLTFSTFPKSVDGNSFVASINAATLDSSHLVVGQCGNTLDITADKKAFAQIPLGNSDVSADYHRQVFNNNAGIRVLTIPDWVAGGGDLRTFYKSYGTNIEIEGSLQIGISYGTPEYNEVNSMRNMASQTFEDAMPLWIQKAQTPDGITTRKILAGFKEIFSTLQLTGTELHDTSSNSDGITSNDPAGSVLGMTKYTDSNFGFSFWYPYWSQVTEVSTGNNEYGSSAKILKTLAAPDFTIDEVYSSDSSILSGVDPGPGSSLTSKYFFNSQTHTWMYTNDGGPKGGTMGTNPADLSHNTMGGLHIFYATSRYSVKVIIPLSAHNFIVAYAKCSNATSYTCTETARNQFLAAINTITATDPSVATPVSSSNQTAAIEAEAAFWPHD